MYFRKVLFSDTLHIAASRLQSQKAGYALHFKQGWGAKVLVYSFNLYGLYHVSYSPHVFLNKKKLYILWF